MIKSLNRVRLRSFWGAQSAWRQTDTQADVSFLRKIKLTNAMKVVLQYLATAASKAEDPQLAKFIVRGVAIHNSGLSPHDRGLVERAFLSGRYDICLP